MHLARVATEPNRELQRVIRIRAGDVDAARRAPQLATNEFYCYCNASQADNNRSFIGARALLLPCSCLALASPSTRLTIFSHSLPFSPILSHPRHASCRVSALKLTESSSKCEQTHTECFSHHLRSALAARQRKTRNSQRTLCVR